MQYSGVILMLYRCLAFIYNVPTFEIQQQIKADFQFYDKHSAEGFCKKGVLGNFAKFTGKHLCQSIFFNKAAGLRPAILLKKRPWHRCSPVNFAKFLRTPFLIEHLWWLFLHRDEMLLTK